MLTKTKDKMKPFSRLTKAEKRVAIAHDALRQIRRGFIRPKVGRYVSLKTITELPLLSLDHCELKELLNNDTKNCQACAKGTLLITEVMERNKFTTGEYGIHGIASQEIECRLSGIFSAGQLDTIECAFEKFPINDTEGILFKEYIVKLHGWNHVMRKKNDLAKAAILFGKRYAKADERLIAILKNIIKNKGTFIP